MYKFICYNKNLWLQDYNLDHRPNTYILQTAKIFPVYRIINNKNIFIYPKRDSIVMSFPTYLELIRNTNLTEFNWRAYIIDIHMLYEDQNNFITEYIDTCPNITEYIFNFTNLCYIYFVKKNPSYIFDTSGCQMVGFMVHKDYIIRYYYE